MDERDVRERVGRAETLLEKVESLPDPEARATAVAAVEALLDLYGEGLARIIALAARLGGDPLLSALAGDDLLAHLLLLHDLHPDDLETRIHRALEEARPYLQSHGAGAILVDIERGTARLRLEGLAGGATSVTSVRRVVEHAIERAAPDLAGIAWEGVADPPSRPAGFVPLSALGGIHPPAPAG